MTFEIQPLYFPINFYIFRNDRYYCETFTSKKLNNKISCFTIVRSGVRLTTQAASVIHNHQPVHQTYRALFRAHVCRWYCHLTNYISRFLTRVAAEFTINCDLDTLSRAVVEHFLNHNSIKSAVTIFGRPSTIQYTFQN